MCQRKAHGVEEGYYIRREHGNEMRIKRDEFACEMEEGGDWSLRLRNVEGRVVGLLLSTQPCCLLFAVFCITWDHLLLFASSSSHYSFLFLLLLILQLCIQMSLLILYENLIYMY